MFYNCLPSEYDHKKNVLLVYIKKKKKKKKYYYFKLKKKKKKENCYNNLCQDGTWMVNDK